MGRIKAGITSGAGAILFGIWSAYSIYTTAAELPEDAGRFAKMLADPPIYLPWLMLAACVVVLGWSLWPHTEPASEGVSERISQGTHGPNSPTLVGPFHGPVTIGAPQAQEKEEKPKTVFTDQNLAGLERLMAPSSRQIDYEKPKPDLPMAGLNVRLYKLYGPPPQDPHARSDWDRAMNLRIIDAVVHNDMTVWGRFQERALSDIHRQDLKQGRIDHRKGWFSHVTDWGTVRYEDLHFNRQQVERQWPVEKEEDSRRS